MPSGVYERKKKVNGKPDDLDAVEAASESEAIPTPEGEPPLQPPKRGRGRPPKVKSTVTFKLGSHMSPEVVRSAGRLPAQLFAAIGCRALMRKMNGKVEIVPIFDEGLQTFTDECFRLMLDERGIELTPVKGYVLGSALSAVSAVSFGVIAAAQARGFDVPSPVVESPNGTTQQASEPVQPPSAEQSGSPQAAAA